MAATPANIMRRIGESIASETGTATIVQIKRMFVRCGYGPTKVDKWIKVFLDEEMLYPVGKNDNGEMMYKSIWWY